jgi:hypothetical protein
MNDAALNSDRQGVVVPKSSHRAGDDLETLITGELIGRSTLCANRFAPVKSKHVRSRQTEQLQS